MNRATNRESSHTLWLLETLVIGLGLTACRLSAPDSSETIPLVTVQPAPLVQFRGGNSSGPGVIGDTDCNSPAHWEGSTLYLFNSAGHPWRSSGPGVFQLDADYIRCEFNDQTNGGRWIECTWKQPGGWLYGWYHFEPAGLISGKPLTAPRIGAARSRNNGATWENLGVVLEAPPNTLNRDTRNFYFAGGNGDFCALLDRQERFLYFFISTYAGSVQSQGIAMARMAWADRDHPVGRVCKWHNGAWREPGVGGQVSPVFPARNDWHRADADAFWGPSVHWNHYLKRYVMLMNRAIDKDWTQEGIYVAYSRDPSNPAGWSLPAKLPVNLRTNQWYPQVIGLDARRAETDKSAGQVARLFVRGESRWELHFARPQDPGP
jgi:hypothetical protein